LKGVAEIQNEINILKRLDHPNIVKGYDSFNWGKKNVAIVMEHCEGGDLYSRTPYSERDASKIVSQILSAVHYMHSKGIMHRDIKYENILFEKTTHDSKIKIIDFGLSKIKKENNELNNDMAGTLYSMAPEVLEGGHSFEADMWSIGVVTFMLLSNKFPFGRRKWRLVIQRIKKCDYSFNYHSWRHVSNQGREFVSSLIKLDPNERLDAWQALYSPWLQAEHKQLLDTDKRRQQRRDSQAWGTNPIQ